jgi:hypothetical protein
LRLGAAVLLYSDEWKARHALMVPGGVMTLGIAPARRRFFPGPADPTASDAWFAEL